jgi:gliding motility-associated-like protein/uncharacterized repeat protein (TIGR01451 family)
MFKSVLITCIIISSLLVPFLVHSQINNYNPAANIQTLPLGSLVIGMDNSTQVYGSDFNLKAYGLVNQLLKNGVPVKWIINSNKSHLSDTDLNITVQREFPNLQSGTSSYNFKTGPFAIDSSHASSARTLIASYGNNVNVYRTINNASVDVQYTLTSPLKAALLNDGGGYQYYKNILDSSGFEAGDYDIISVVALNSANCYTSASENNDDENDLSDTLFTNPVKRFVTSGRNFFAQYDAIEPHEKNSHYMADSNLIWGIDPSTNFKNITHPFIQIDGNLPVSPGSSESMFLPTGSFFANTYSLMDNNSGAGSFKTITRKYGSTQEGGNVFYFCGDPDDYSWTGNDNKNAYRMYLNAMMMPAQTNSNCDKHDLNVSVLFDKTSLCLNDTLNLKIIINNNGNKNATNVEVKAPSYSNFSLISGKSSSGSFNSATNSWNMAAINIGSYDTLTLRYRASIAGTANFSSYVVNNSLDSDISNDSVKFSFLINALPLTNSGNDTSVCVGSPVILGMDSISGNTYQWKSLSGTFTSGNARPVLVPALTASYELSKTSILTGCKNSDTIHISVNSLPSFDIGANKQACLGDTLNISFPVNAALSYNWNSIPAGISIAGSKVKIDFPGKMMLYAKGTDTGTGCSSFDSVTINVSTPPVNSAAGNDLNTFHYKVQLSGNSPSVGTGIWSVVEGGGVLENPSDPATNISRLSLGVNILRWTITNGVCPPSTDEVSVYVKDLNVPNGFSPNNDGVNDEFVIEGIEEFPGSKIEIITRWGIMVYSSDNYNNNWAGDNSRGEKLPDDTYYYILSTAENKIYKSYVVLKR